MWIFIYCMISFLITYLDSLVFIPSTRNSSVARMPQWMAIGFFLPTIFSSGKNEKIFSSFLSLTSSLWECRSSQYPINGTYRNENDDDASRKIQQQQQQQLFWLTQMCTTTGGKSENLTIPCAIKISNKIPVGWGDTREIFLGCRTNLMT